MPEILEQVVEDYLANEVEKLGGFSRKLKWIGRRAAPDRLVFYRGVYFVELKRPKKEAEPAQKREHDRLRKQGALVCVINTKDQVDEFILAIQGDKKKWSSFQKGIKV